ncbi:hypothetical protein [Aromatoleum toluclasticum]|uniref:hypothetical protein n=1 Tax=Aromatoleum toluclasticum TaxID=92003 RepID=UPI0012FBA51B|nr:hypothetical protein [Aromatoleum toluclasticum]
MKLLSLLQSTIVLQWIRGIRVNHLMTSLLFALAATGAEAQTPTLGEATWICWYAKGTHVHCRLGIEESAAVSSAGSSSTHSAPVDTVPEGRRPLPKLVRTILSDPGKLAGRTITIPLFTESDDRAFVRELAEAVMCGARKVCSVLFVDTPTEIALTMDMLADPALN